MEIPGLTENEITERAEAESEKLLEELKEQVKTELEDVGTLRKKLTVTVPADIIAQHMERNFKELRADAIVPGFRKGHAPLVLVQKRFGTDVRDSLKTTILGQSFFAATENLKIESLGDPLFSIESGDGFKLMELDEALEHITLPESGDFTYVCEFEIKPEFELPELEHVPVKAPKIEITDEQVEEQLMRHRKMRGRLEPVADSGAKKDDTVIADVKLSVDGAVVKTEENVELGVRPLRLDGVSLMELEKALTGAKAGDERSTECELPDDYERSDLRGKKAKFDFAVHEVKRLKPAAIEQIVEQSGYDSEQELRDAIRDDMEAELDRMIDRAKREQVLEYLLDKVKLDLPEKLSARQTDRAVMRKVIELQQRGVPSDEIDARIDELRTSAQEEVGRALKLEFIMEKVAEQLEVDVTDEEVNTEIARMARMYGQRFDRVRDNLHRRGVLTQLAEQIRQDKCTDKLLADADITETSGEDSGDSADDADSKKSRARSPKRKK